MNDNQSSRCTGERVDGSVISYEPERDEPLTEAIVNLVSDVSDRDVMDLQPLYTVVDPEALNGIFRSTPFAGDRGDGRVVFDYAGYVITIVDNDRIEIGPLDRSKRRVSD